MIVAVLFWIILSYIVAKLGSKKKIGGLSAFLVSIIFSPIIGLLVVIASGEKKEEQKSNPHVLRLTDKAMRIKEKNLDESLSIILEALQIDPFFSRTHFNLACIYSLKTDKTNN